jgi:small neutral amino acid transporter SnatA (MarC family)
MKLLEGKSPTERNKIIAAITLGVMAVLALGYTFGGSFFGSRKVSVTVTASPTP